MYPEFEYWGERVVDSCRNLLGAAGGFISLLGEEGKEIEVFFFGWEGWPRTEGLGMPTSVRRLRDRAYESGEVVYQNNIAEPSENIGFHSILFAPLTIQGEIPGLLGIVDKPGGFGENDARTASTFAEIASIALHNGRTLDALRHSEEKFSSVVRQTADAVISIDECGQIVFWSDSAEVMFGYSAEEVSGKPLRVVVPERFHDAQEKAFHRALATGESLVSGRTVEVAGLRKDGSEFPLNMSPAVWRIRGQTFVTGTLRDVTERNNAVRAFRETRVELEERVRARTEELLVSCERSQREMEERRKADEALRESETKYRIVAENTYDWEWWLQPDGRFIYVSPSCKRITGHGPEEFMSEPTLILRIIHPDDKRLFIEHRNEVDRTLAGGEVEFRVVRPDGTHRWVAHLCQPAFDEAGRFLGHRGSNRDVTAQKQAEEALRQSESTLRSLSSQLLTVQEKERRRIASELHDGVNQTLAAVKFALDSKLSQMGKADAPPGISLEKIISLVQHGIDESRRIQMDLRPSVLDDLGISATLSWFAREFQNVYTHIRVARNVEATEADVPDALKIVIFRIVQEALNNVAKHSKANLVRVTLRTKNGGIELEIEDNGQGFDIDKVAEGFGLVSMKERAELSGGSLEIESTTGKGTKVRAVWPM